jgi:nucleotide-binding universal stress UspA family protein
MEQTLIVHPTDLLATSEAAFDHALKLGLAEHGRLILVHAHTYAVQEIPSLDGFPHVRETLIRWGLLAPGAPQSAVSEKLGLYVSKAEIGGLNAEASLVRLLHDREAGMVVLGTRALDGLKRLVNGSFAQQLARDAKIPALFVPNGAEGFVDRRDGSVRLRNVLIPVAEDPDATGAIAAAQTLSGFLQQAPQFHLLHVGSGSAPAYRVAPHAQAIVRSGHVVQTIVEVADEIGAELIVMATAGHKGFMDALRGSTTEEVLRKAHRALLAVPAV